MHLLNTQTYLLTDFPPNAIPPYVILSHTWTSAETTYQNITNNLSSSISTPAFSKIKHSCAEASKKGHAWIWIDTCCIDKTSSAILSEAINSMFSWYQHATVCYVYLDDVPGPSDLATQNISLDQAIQRSRWFTRGWTLQELIAPKAMRFFDSTWHSIGSKADIIDVLVTRTGVPKQILLASSFLPYASVGERMSWASERETTRPEDGAYSLMGLFDVHMPVIYGEGLEKAFLRLQKEILMRVPDQTIFAWKSAAPANGVSGLLASSPAWFKGCVYTDCETGAPVEDTSEIRPFSITNMGISISFPLDDAVDEVHGRVKVATLMCMPGSNVVDNEEPQPNVQIHLKPIGKYATTYQRIRTNELRSSEKRAGVRSRLIDGRRAKRILVLDNDQAFHLQRMTSTYKSRHARISQ